jgi:hypothetical protein
MDVFFLALFLGAFYSPGCVILLSTELEMVWTEAVVAPFEVTSRTLSAGIYENQEKLR